MAKKASAEETIKTIKRKTQRKHMYVFNAIGQIHDNCNGENILARAKSRVLSTDCTRLRKAAVTLWQVCMVPAWLYKWKPRADFLLPSAYQAK